MKSRWLRTVASCVLLLAPTPAAFAAVAGTGLPAHEVWFGLGGASSPEKDIFNVPNDLESKPELVLNLSYMRNLDAQKAFGIYLYGATETTPTVTVVDESGSPQNTTFDLYTYNLGVRYRHTFMRGSLSPYAFVGAGWAFGKVDRIPQIRGLQRMCRTGSRLRVRRELPGLGRAIWLVRIGHVGAEALRQLDRRRVQPRAPGRHAQSRPRVGGAEVADPHAALRGKPPASASLAMSRA